MTSDMSKVLIMLWQTCCPEWKWMQSLNHAVNLTAMSKTQHTDPQLTWILSSPYSSGCVLRHTIGLPMASLNILSRFEVSQSHYQWHFLVYRQHLKKICSVWYIVLPYAFQVNFSTQHKMPTWQIPPVTSLTAMQKLHAPPVHVKPYYYVPAHMYLWSKILSEASICWTIQIPKHTNKLVHHRKWGASPTQIVSNPTHPCQTLILTSNSPNSATNSTCCTCSGQQVHWLNGVSHYSFTCSLEA